MTFLYDDQQEDYRHDYSDDDFDDDHQCEDLFYHNYSVEYANQLLNGKHRICSSISRFHRFDHRPEPILKRSPRLMKISTWDQMIIDRDNQNNRSTHSQQKYSSTSTTNDQRQLPSLQQIDQELQRRTQRFIQERSSTNPNENPPNSISNPNENSSERLSEEQLRQVHQQQQLFQQHLINMQRNLEEQQRERGGQGERGERGEGERTERRMNYQENRPDSSGNLSKNERRNLNRNLDYDDDHQEIVQLIETDPYFAAAMEDFVRSHRLLDNSSTRSSSPSSSSSSSLSSSSSSSSSTSSSSSSTSESIERKTSGSLNVGNELLLNEIRGIRHLMKKYLNSKERNNEEIRRGYVHDDPSAERPPYIPRPRKEEKLVHPQAAKYQNLVETMKDIIQRRSPSHRDEPLKPSEIKSTLKSSFKRTNRPPPRPPVPPLSSQNPPNLSQQPTTNISSISSISSRSSSSSSLNHRVNPLIPSITPSSLPSIPRAPPLPPSLAPSYENTMIRSSQRISSDSRQLSYGNQNSSSNIYDRFFPRFYSFK